MVKPKILSGSKILEVKKIKISESLNKHCRYCILSFWLFGFCVNCFLALMVPQTEYISCCTKMSRNNDIAALIKEKKNESSSVNFEGMEIVQMKEVWCTKCEVNYWGLFVFLFCTYLKQSYLHYTIMKDYFIIKNYLIRIRKKNFRNVFYRSRG